MLIFCLLQQALSLAYEPQVQLSKSYQPHAVTIKIRDRFAQHTVNSTFCELQSQTTVCAEYLLYPETIKINPDLLQMLS